MPDANNHILSSILHEVVVSLPMNKIALHPKKHVSQDPSPTSQLQEHELEEKSHYTDHQEKQFLSSYDHISR